MSPRESVLISPSELQGIFDSERPVTILDVRWSLGRDDGSELYLAGHLPTAVYVDLDSELSSPASPQLGRHPLPDVKTLSEDARRWGVQHDAPVIVYDNDGGLSAARAWWVLRWAGKADVRILDGGLAAWERAGGEVVTEVPKPRLGDVDFVGGQMPLLDADDAQHLAAGADSEGLLIDVRASERYAGRSEPMDPRAGHIPGAINLPTGENLTGEGEFGDTEQLRKRFSSAGLDVDSHIPGSPGPDHPVGVYCGSGVSACHTIAALAAIGVQASLYPGSWSQWSHDSARAVATASDPG